MMGKRKGLVLLGLLLVLAPTGALAIERVAVFYQFTPSTLKVLGDPKTGLPNDSQHLYIFTASTPSGVSTRAAAMIHACGSSFKYGPCFDVHKYKNIMSADEETCAKAAREYRDQAIAAGADYFGYNEAYSNTHSSAEARKRVAWLLKYMHEPDKDGKQLEGIFYLVERNCFPERWKGQDDPAFWKTVNDTCRLVVAEHYHGHGFLNLNTLAYLREHYSSWYLWFKRSQDPVMREIADQKYCILHSTRYGPGTSGWAGANSDVETIDSFRKDLAKAAWLSRALGNPNNIGFGPMNDAHSNTEVFTRVRDLLKWHYCRGGSREELKPYEPFTFARRGANATGVR